MRIRAWWLGAKATTGPATSAGVSVVHFEALDVFRSAAVFRDWVHGRLAPAQAASGWCWRCFSSTRSRIYFFFVTERYRFPIEPLLVLVATYGVMWMGSFRRPEAKAGEPVGMR